LLDALTRCADARDDGYAIDATKYDGINSNANAVSCSKYDATTRSIRNVSTYELIRNDASS